MASDPSPNGPRPSRPKTPEDYTPTPVRTVAHTDTHAHLMNDRQRESGPLRIHEIPRDRFTSFNQLQPQSPVTGESTKSKKSLIDSARRKLSAAFGKTKPAVQSAVASSKDGLTRVATNTLGLNETDNETDDIGSEESLFHRPTLPKLKIPDVNEAVEQALNSPCSTDTEKSENFGVLGQSPTSRELKSQWLEGHPGDISAEFHNMLSARRRVRKGKFGRLVSRFQRARPTWDDHFSFRAPNDNLTDRRTIRELTDALQEQKDHATRLVQNNPSPYPGLEPVSSPGSTLKMWWQHKSSYR
ncbi:hypothetical protein F5Y10DRAFT_282744 [Nemania abortiva]|nr:hypothetical protein F5Y10DRAFT_282744 [Nemania abortiva]